MTLKSMSDVLGGSNVTVDIDLHLTRKTRVKAVMMREDEEQEVSGTVSVDKER